MSHLLHIFSTLSLGGPQRRFLDLLNGNPDGMYHSVIAMDGDYSALDELPSDSPVKILGRLRNKGGLVSTILAIRRYLKTLNPDLLLTYNWGASEWALACRFLPPCPLLHLQDGFNPEEQETELSRRRWFRRLAYGGNTHVLVPSLTLRAIAQQSWGICSDKLHTVPNGIDTDKFEGTAEQAIIDAYGITDEDFVIGTVAALRPEKNLGDLIEAFSLLSDQYPNSKLVIVGDGTAKTPLKMLSERIGLKDRVIFTGKIENPARIVPRFNLFALSSKTEQMPLSVIEAMAASKALVSTDVGDVRLMVSSKNQPFVAGNGPARLAESLDALMNDAQLRAEIGQDNRTKAFSLYSLDAMQKAHFTLYSQLLRKS